MIREEKLGEKINNFVSSVIFAISAGRVPVRKFSESPLFKKKKKKTKKKKGEKGEGEEKEEKEEKRHNDCTPVLIN